MKLRYLLLATTLFSPAAFAGDTDIYIGTGNTVGGAPISQPVGTCTGCVSMPISGTFSASLSGFTPSGNYATLAVPSGSSSAATNLPAGSPTVVVFQNTGSNGASISFGATAATATEIQVPSNSSVPLTVPSGATQFTAYGVGGTTNLVVLGGTGLFTGFGGGSAGGGSGSNASVGSTGSAVPGSGTYIAANNGGTLTGLASDSAGLKVDASGQTVPVSGTFWQTTQPVSGTITANQGIANTAANAWTVTPVIGGAVNASGNPLFVQLTAGAATIGNVGGLGTAGTPSGGVVSIQGVASGTAVPVSGTVAATQSGNWTSRVVGNAGGIMDAAGQNATSAANELLVAAQFNTTPTTLTTGNMSPLQMDSAGNLLVNIKAGAGSGGTASSFAAAFPSTGTAIGVKNGSNMVNLTADGSGNLDVNCITGCSGGTGGTSAVDEAAFTLGTTSYTPVGGYYQTTPTTGPLTTGQSGVAQLTQYRALMVNLRTAAGAEIGTAASPVNVIGTGTAGAAASGVTTIQGIASMTPVQVSQATAANLNATVIGAGTAGTANAGVVTVQGIASMTPVQVSQATAANLNVTAVLASGTAAVGNFGVAQASTTSGQVGELMQGAVTTSAPSYTTAQTSPLSLDTSGNLRTNCVAGCSGGNASNASDAVATSSTNGVQNSWNYGFNGTTWDRLRDDTNKYLFVDVGVALPAGSALIGNVGLAQASTTSGQSGPLMQCAVTTSAPTYTTAQTDPCSMDTSGEVRVTNPGLTGLAQASTTSGQNGSLIMGAVTTSPPSYTTAQTDALSMDVNGNTRVTLAPTTSGGLSVSSTQVAANTTAIVIKGSAGQLYSIEAFNNSATVAYVKLYNATSATCGSGTVVQRAMIPANASGAGFVIDHSNGIAFSTGITMCVTTGFADSDATAPAANTYIVNAFYK